MKKIHLLLLGLTICLFSACHDDIWDAIDGLDSRVTKLEELCKEMNTNITSLQTIVDVLQSNDFITSVVEIKKDGEVIGYTITFGKHDPITIYHGQDGPNGADGKDGFTPVIGVEQDTDGVYYWTLNGEWLLDDNGNKLPVSGKDGQNGTNGSNGQDGADGKDGQDGEDGKDGADGQDGKDGITPQLKIEEGYWYISYDNGATWTQLGKATGEDGKDGQNGTDGKDGKDGQDGDSMFQSVTQDENYVYFTLDDGTVIKIAKGTTNGEEPNPNDIIEFTDFEVRLALIELGVDTDKDSEISYAEAANVQRLDFSSHKFVSFREFKYFTNLQAVSFYKTGVREIIFPENGVDSILENAFQGVSCKDLVITEGTKYIGKTAFTNSPIENLKLPASIVEIDTNAFQSSSIKSFVFPPSISYMPDGSFYDCKNLVEFTFPENYEGEFIFGKVEEESLTLPTIIYWNTINYTKTLYSVRTYMNSSLGMNREWDLYGLGCACVATYSGSSTYYYPKNTQRIIFGDKVEQIPNYICYGMSSLDSVVIGNNIKNIGEKAFYHCSQLTSVTIPNSVTNIGESAFEDCTSLTSVTIANGVVKIGNYAFENCTSLTSITIPESVTEIGYSAFTKLYYQDSNYGPKTVYCKAVVPPVINGSPFNLQAIIYVPRASVEDYKVVWSSYAKRIVGYDF